MLSIPCTTGYAEVQNLPQPLSATQFREVGQEEAKLGQLLFYDKILSGNRNIACNTCHSTEFGTSDGLALGVGEGGIGIGPERTTGEGDDRIRKRIPRNSPGLWNLGATSIDVLFHDGRVSLSDDYDNGYNTPAEEWLPAGLDNILAVQALFPMTSQFEMAGNPKENEVAGARHDRIDAVWPIITKRVAAIPEYVERMSNVYDNVDSASDVSISHVANALAAFMAFEWRSIDSPFDAYLNGDKDALSAEQLHGKSLFYGTAGCSRCHSGSLLSDQQFHALAVPPIGPGRTRLFDPMPRDVGFMGETDDLNDQYRFRTPMLRNVALTSPYGHNGTLPTLEMAVKHHLNPQQSLANWRREFVQLPDASWLAATDFVIWQDVREMNRLRAKVDIEPVSLENSDIKSLVAFLHALTGTESVQGRIGVPSVVPSGLSVD